MIVLVCLESLLIPSALFNNRLIQEDKPEEQSSRWLSETIRPPQYVTLRLSKPSIVKSVVFSKFHRPHACNVRRIRILGGLTVDTMTCLCEGSVNLSFFGVDTVQSQSHRELRNDGEKELLNLRHEISGYGRFPCHFIKLGMLIR